MLPTIFPVFSCLITILFFGIPRSYLIHIKRSLEYRGRLNNMQQTWEAYITRLTREYSHFLLIVSYLCGFPLNYNGTNCLTCAVYGTPFVSRKPESVFCC